MTLDTLNKSQRGKGDDLNAVKWFDTELQNYKNQMVNSPSMAKVMSLG